ncbi:MAG: LLM class flavin-dependent oxidoreductase [Actinoplanes sp.]
MTAPRIGFMFDCGRPPEELPAFAAAVEETGADDLWVVEDLGYNGGITAAAVALAATTRLRVGIGIAPVALRNPALLAMELATLARVHPGRLVAGVGHGVTEWMRQVGAETPHKLAMLEETTVAVRALLAGGKVTQKGRTVTLDGVALHHPPAEPPPIVTGVVRPRSLELSGRVADGTILAEGAGPAEITAALTHIDRGRAAGDRPAHELIVFTFLQVTPPTEVTREKIAAQAAWLGVPPEELFSLIGPAAEIPAKVAALHDAGAATVIFRPAGSDPAREAREAMATLRAG